MGLFGSKQPAKKAAPPDRKAAAPARKPARTAVAEIVHRPSAAQQRAGRSRLAAQDREDAAHWTREAARERKQGRHADAVASELMAAKARESARHLDR